MTYSKNFHLIILAFVFVLISCGKKDDHLSNPDSTATFFVDKEVKLAGKVLVSRDAQQKPIQKDFKIVACMKDNAMLSPVQFVDFAVQAGDIEIQKTSDFLGCIIWDEQIKFNGLDNEDELLVVRKIKALNGHAGSVSVELSINPWSTEDTVTVADLRYDEALKAKARPNSVQYSLSTFQSAGCVDSNKGNCEKAPSFAMAVVKTLSALSDDSSDLPTKTKMRLDAIQWQFLGHDYSAYEITDTLNLKVAHLYRIRISPQFIRENFNGKQIFETISSGKVKFSIAILKDNIKPLESDNYKASDVLSTSEFIGEMIDGVMVADVTLKFQDLAPLTGRTYLLLSSSSLPGYIQFRDGNYISPVGPLGAATTISLVPSKWNAETLHKNNLAMISSQENKRKSMGNLEYFKTASGFISIPSSLVISTRGGAQSVGQILLNGLESSKSQDIDYAAKSAICRYLVQDKNYGASLCDKDFIDLINFRKREIVESITNPVPTREGVTLSEDLNVNMNYLVQNEKNVGNGQAAKVGWNAGLNAGLTGALAAGLDLDVLDLAGGRIPGFGILQWLSKFLGNNKPIDPNNPGVPAGFVDPKNSFGMKLGASLGGNIGGAMTYNNDLWTWSLANSKKETGSISTSVKFTVNAELKNFKFSGIFKKCWLINLSQIAKDRLAKIKGTNLDSLGLPKGLISCSPRSIKGERQEMYVLMNSVAGIVNSPLTDPLNSAEAPLRMFFRGPMGYSIFKNLVAESDVEIKFNKFPIEQVINDVKSLKNEGDIYLNQEFPGMLMTE